jgi:hypothetical protein
LGRGLGRLIDGRVRIDVIRGVLIFLLVCAVLPVPAMGAVFQEPPPTTPAEPPPPAPEPEPTPDAPPKPAKASPPPRRAAPQQTVAPRPTVSRPRPAATPTRPVARPVQRVTRPAAAQPRPKPKPRAAKPRREAPAKPKAAPSSTRRESTQPEAATAVKPAAGVVVTTKPALASAPVRAALFGALAFSLLLLTVSSLPASTFTSARAGMMLEHWRAQAGFVGLSLLAAVGLVLAFTLWMS